MRKNPEKKQEAQSKLIELSYQKIKIIKQFHANRSENYYYGLAMGDLAEIYLKFNELSLASEKIISAIKMLSNEPMHSEKLIEFYLSSAIILDKLNKDAESLTDLKNVRNHIMQAI